MSKIPEARERLMKLIALLDWTERGTPQVLDFVKTELRAIHGLMTREAPVRKAPRRSWMTPQKARDMRDYAQAHPDEGFREIGERFSVSIGRVSEVLTGKSYTEDDEELL